ncbi:hypothetical protein CISIN_1g0340811mg, partial [Citrus sinensis]
FATPL